MFFSLDPLATKNQLLTPNVSQSFFFSFHFKKKRDSLFQNGATTKNFSWHLVFSSWFFVASGSNEKNTKKFPFSFMKSKRYIKGDNSTVSTTQWGLNLFLKKYFYFYFCFYSVAFSREKNPLLLLF